MVLIRIYHSQFPDEPNKYRATPLTAGNLFIGGQRTVDVQFHTSDDDDNSIDPPDPRFLKIHAAIAKVLHACGAAAHFKAVEEDADDYGTLQPNGETDIELLLRTRLAVAH